MKLNYIILLLLLIPITTASPNITEWSNNYTSNNSTSFTIPKYTNVSFNITLDAIAENWTWVGIDSYDGNNTTISNASKNFSIFGEQTVSVHGSNNSSGNSSAITWTINVLGDCCYTLNGTVINAIDLPLQNAKVEINGSSDYTDVNGYYSFDNLTEANYEVLSRAIGYSNNTQTIILSSNQTLNFTMKERMNGVKASPSFEGIGLVGVISILYLYSFKRNKIK